MNYPPIFRGPILAGATLYVGIPFGPINWLVFVDVQWRDAVSSATITLETTASNSEDAPVDVPGQAWQWKTDATVTIAGPTAIAAGSTKVTISNAAAPRGRLKIVAAANCDFEIYALRKGD